MIGNNLLMAGDEGYNLTRSLRFRASASAYLSRTLTTPTNANKWTWSAWVKLGLLSGTQVMFNAVQTSSTSEGYIWFSPGTIQLYNVDGGSITANLTTTAVYRDPSSWYHVLVSVDTTQATAANRILLYVNGVQVTSFSTSNMPAQNQSLIFNRAVGHSISRSAMQFDGYLAEVNFIDGQALTPSSFGSTNSTTGVWQPAAYTGTYGTNGFYLPFTDNSALTTASNVGLGKDFSGNGNYWTTNNISITAGVTYDSMTDVPTLTSASAANFAVLNPLNALGSATTASGNLEFSVQSSSSSGLFSTIACSGKNYFEERGITFASSILAIACVNNISASSGVLYYTDGRLYVNNVLQGTYATWSSGDTMACDVDTVTRQIRVYKNNVQIGSTGTASGTDPLFFSISGSGSGSGAGSGAVNFGQRPFTYTPPSGFVALNAYNLPEGSITTSGSFVGNVSTDGPSVYLNGVPTAMTINGNAVTLGTHADKTAYGFKVRSSSTSYNSTGTNTYSITTTGAKFKFANAQGNP